jgi:hypothetical protein
MTVTDTTAQIPGYIPGTWVIDPVHSEVAFSVRHLMLSKVRGRFTSFEGQLVTGDNPLDSSGKPPSTWPRSTQTTPTATRTCVPPTSSTSSSTRP